MMPRCNHVPTGFATAVALLLGACLQRSDTDGQAAADLPSSAIFREVELGAGRIRLGDTLSTAMRAAIGAGAASAQDSVLSLPPRTFGGAERITLHLSAERRLARIVLEYAHGADFEAMVRDYHELGPGTRSIAQRRGEMEPLTLVTWTDPVTGFRLERDPNRSAWTVRSQLWDRALTTVPDRSANPPPNER